MKGIEDGTHLRMSEVIAEVTGAGPDRIAVITGPNLAREIAARQYAATVVACADDAMAKHLQQACHTPYFRPYTNPDVIGCELGGAVKNVIALAVGIAVGMGLGDNTRAMLITRGLAEIARLGAALGADQHTFAGLAGMGDLVATCSSPLSRNRTFGENLGRGMPLADAAASASQVTEGVKSAGPVLELARAHGVEMPITEVVAGVTQGRIGIGGGRHAAGLALGQAGALRSLTAPPVTPREENDTEHRTQDQGGGRVRRAELGARDLVPGRRECARGARPRPL